MQVCRYTDTLRLEKETACWGWGILTLLSPVKIDVASLYWKLTSFRFLTKDWAIRCRLTLQAEEWGRQPAGP